MNFNFHAPRKLFFIALIDCEIFSDGFVVNDNDVDEGGSGEDDDDEEVVQKKKKRRRHLSGKLIFSPVTRARFRQSAMSPLPLPYSCSYRIGLEHNPTFFPYFLFSRLRVVKIDSINFESTFIFNSEEELTDDDYDLLQENLGVSVKRVSAMFMCAAFFTSNKAF